MQGVASGPSAGAVATDETDRLISSSKIEGTASTTGRASAWAPSPASWSMRSGQVAYAVLSFGGFLGLGKRCHPLPWHVLACDTAWGGAVVDLDKDRLTGAPSFAEGREPRLGRPALRQGIDAYYADRPSRPRDEAAIDAAVDDTFPASDRPSGRAARPPAPARPTTATAAPGRRPGAPVRVGPAGPGSALAPASPGAGCPLRSAVIRRRAFRVAPEGEARRRPPGALRRAAGSHCARGRCAPKRHGRLPPSSGRACLPVTPTAAAAGRATSPT